MQMMETFVHPNKPATNTASGWLKAFAFAAMLCDHVGKMFFPQYRVLRYIGRLAFPLFAYSIALGAAYSKNPVSYFERVVLLAVISQPLYALGLNHENAAMYSVSPVSNPLGAAAAFYLGSWKTPSILLTLALGLGILLFVREKRFVAALGVYLLCERFSSALDYGINGVRFILLCYLLLEHRVVFLLLGTGFWLLWSRQGSGYSFFGYSFSMRIFGLPAVVFAALPLRSGFRFPRWLNYGFYPLHLLAIAVIAHSPI